MRITVCIMQYTTCTVAIHSTSKYCLNANARIYSTSVYQKCTFQTLDYNNSVLNAIEFRI